MSRIEMTFSAAEIHFAWCNGYSAEIRATCAGAPDGVAFDRSSTSSYTGSVSQIYDIAILVTPAAQPLQIIDMMLLDGVYCMQANPNIVENRRY
jgi:hypothetical protein